MLECERVSPEVVHHGDGGSEIAAVDSGINSEGGGDGGVAEKGTWNVGCAVRHEQLWVEERDLEGRVEARKMVREVLMRADGGCPIDLVKAERSWKGCEWRECGAQS